MLDRALDRMERLRMVAIAQKLNNAVSNARDRQMNGAFAESDWQDSPELALACNALIWLIVALPFVLAILAVLRRLAAT